MASYRSQSNIPMRSGGSSSSNQKTSSTRLPVRSPTPTSLRSEDHAPPSKLVKRRTTRQDGRPQAEIAAEKGSRTQKGAAPEIPPRARRPSKNASSSKDLPNLPQQPSRLEPPVPQRTPSLVSGSSASTNDSPRSNRTGVLRKKQSIIGQHVSRTRAMAASQSTGSAPSTKEAYQDPFPETVFGITMPTTSSPHQMEAEPTYEPTFELGLDTSHGFASNMLPPPPLSAMSGSPSTRYTDSPFSHSSTPTSMSSYSPGNGLKTMTPRLRQVSPTVNRPPVTKRRTDETASPAESQGLEALKEAGSSSSGSTVIEDEVPQTRENRRGSRLPAPSPTLAPSDSRLTRTRSGRSSSQSESSQKKPVQHPPEFAHLADAQPMATNKARPSRPSRDGTSDISGLRQPSPVIQSNLTTLNSNRRMSSGQGQGPVVGSAAATTSKTRLAAPSKASSRNPSPSPNTFHSRGPTPDYPSDSENRPAQAAPPTTPSPSKFSRFGLFRRNKTEPTAPPKEKQSRKGPAAGTGHERYGRYTRRGRSGSVGSTTGSVGRSPSADSTSGAPLRPTASRKNSMSSKGGDSEVDDFFLDRLTPVVIRGEGSTDGGSTRSPVSSRKGNSMDSTDNGHGPESKMSSAITSAASSRTDLDESRPTLLPSAMPDHSRGCSPVKADPSKNTPSLAERRSFRRSQMFDKEKTTVKIPGKIDTRVPPAPSSIDSSFADQSSVPDTANSFADGKEGFWLRPKKDAQPKQQRKAESKPRKWNFFQRSQPASKKKEELSKASAAEEQTVSSRTMPHYAMRDPTTFVDPVDIQQIMREIDAATDSDNQNSSRPSSFGQDQSRSREREPSMLLPPPPKLDTVLMEEQQRSQKLRPGLSRLNTNQSSISSTQSQGIPQQTNASSANNASPSPKVEPLKAPAKTSRLPQVGRIPQVVSQRDDRHLPPNQSFSRPFVSNNLGPQQSPDPNFEGAESSKSAITAALDQVTAPSWPNAASFPPEFLAFSPRKNSDISFGSSSGTSYFPAMTAVIPKPGAPSTEDEVWKEYDDLIDEVLTPEEGPKSGTLQQEAKTPTKQSGTPQKVYQLSSTPSSIYKAQFDNIDYSQIPIPDWSMLEPPPQLLSTFRSNGTLDTTGTITNLIASYGERNLSIGTAHGGESRPESTKRDSVTTFRSSVATSIESEPDSDSSPPYTGSSENTKNRYRDTVLMEMAEERNDGKESMANLRFDALMTSKWLSFGRVLFSPVHSELKNSAEDRVLIIDGLGKDWSFYCALTYPGATVFNLGPNPVEASESEQTGAFSSLPNHRHVHHPDISQPFPFPKGYFNAVVFRFPVATSEATYRFAIYECKRVLRPGGFLEISVLDLDMMNMGNRARRAVRNLKMRMQTNDSSTSLKPASDNIQRLLGRRGFENLNRCMVGVPAAGAIPSSRDNSIDNGKTINKDGRKSISFSDLLTNADKNKDGDDDECITKMVAKVGRWWYTRCYETSTLPDGDLSQSIWADQALLKECEEWQTSFRLLLCYAQKPTITPRRTISV